MGRSGKSKKGKKPQSPERRDPPLRTTPASYRQWGRNLDRSAVEQMNNAVKLPVSVAGALMPDAHQGYGLPIGGVLAVADAVIPYAVGVDIACRMRMSVLDWPVNSLEDRHHELAEAIEKETRFGVGAGFARNDRRQHAVMDRDWTASAVTARMKDRAWSQLGSSGGGNHFVEFGILTLTNEDLGLEIGTYLALLTHSGSRGTGHEVATDFSRVARDLQPKLPRELQHLAWLPMSSSAGKEYWAAMELMGHYAAANHELIHHHILQTLGAAAVTTVENHHNFAWRETHENREVIVHRKGAIPAGKGVLGVIPGSMATPGYVVRGRGNPLSIDSAAHGAGRTMSRGAAKKRFKWKQLREMLERRNVVLLSAGLDEAPMAYKDIDLVMSAQKDLVSIVARFDPRLVKMAP